MRLLILVGLGRATLNYGFDAFWVALAGLSLLKSLPGGKDQNGQQLWSLTDWLFKRFYGSLRLDILSQSRKFATELLDIYQNQPSVFLDDVNDFIDGTEAASDSVAKKKEVAEDFNAKANDLQKVKYLTDWLAPRGTRK